MYQTLLGYFYCFVYQLSISELFLKKNLNCLATLWEIGGKLEQRSLLTSKNIRSIIYLFNNRISESLIIKLKLKDTTKYLRCQLDLPLRQFSTTGYVEYYNMNTSYLLTAQFCTFLHYILIKLKFNATKIKNKKTHFFHL